MSRRRWIRSRSEASCGRHFSARPIACSNFSLGSNHDSTPPGPHSPPPRDEAVLPQVAEAHNRNDEAMLVTTDKASLRLPDEVYKALRDVVTAMAGGRAITIATHNTVMTTRTDLALGASGARPWLASFDWLSELSKCWPQQASPDRKADALILSLRSGRVELCLPTASNTYFKRHIIALPRTQRFSLLQPPSPRARAD